MAQYVLNGDKWGSATKGTASGQIQWSFALFNWGGYSFDAIISDPAYQKLVRDAFQAWEDIANIDFVEVTDSATSQFRLGWDAIDGAYGTVGEAKTRSTSFNGGPFSITGAEIRFDTAETWSTVKSYTGNFVNFYTVALHEIGHALGLGHTDDKSTIMFPTSGLTTTFGAGDIVGIQTLYGPAPTTTFVATAGNDRFASTSASETVDGLAGRDTVSFKDPFAAFKVSHAGTVVTVIGNGNDTYLNFERFEFSDGTLAFDTSGNAGMTYRLYQAAFDRVPDKQGLGYWIRELDSGRVDMAVMARNFIASTEFKATYGDPKTVSNANFLKLVYTNVLGRDGEASGTNYWMSELDSGVSRERVLTLFSESNENTAAVAPSIFDGIFFV